jgi:hypothetical protein
MASDPVLPSLLAEGTKSILRNEVMDRFVYSMQQERKGVIEL